MGIAANYEVLVLKELSQYRDNLARIKVLEKTPIGYGMYLESKNKDDKLQDLHRKLKDMPSYMYLNKSELELEAIAFAYLEEYPLGTRAQLREVKNTQVWDPDDRKQRDKLQSKIKKVLDARSGQSDGIKGALERISELQDLQRQNEQIDHVLATLDWYKQDYGRLLRLRYIDSKPVDDIAEELAIVRKTYERWRPKAVLKYAEFSGIAEMCPLR